MEHPVYRCQTCKNWRFPPNISKYTRPIITKFSELVALCVGMINLTFVLQSPVGRCYGNQIIFGAEIGYTRQIPPSFCTGVPKQIGMSQNRYAH